MAGSLVEINAGHRPGELILRALEARHAGPVVVPPTDQVSRFGVEPLEGGEFALVRYRHAALPLPSSVEPIVVFENQASAERALKALQEALMVVEVSVVPVVARRFRRRHWFGLAAAVVMAAIAAIIWTQAHRDPSAQATLPPLPGVSTVPSAPSNKPVPDALPDLVGRPDLVAPPKAAPAASMAIAPADPLSSANPSAPSASTPPGLPMSPGDAFMKITSGRVSAEAPVSPSSGPSAVAAPAPSPTAPPATAGDAFMQAAGH